VAIKSADQITIIDLTDAYSVMLSADSIAFNGGIDTLGTTQSVTINIFAFRGTEKRSPSVLSSDITCPTNVSASVGTLTNQVLPITLTFAAALSSAGKVTINVTVDDVTIQKEFSFAIAFKGEKGDTGDGAIWYSGTAITGTSTTAKAFSSSGITAAKVGDMYLNTSTSYTYRCTVAGAPAVAKWAYTGSLKGATGDGAVWYTGTGITDESTTAAIYSGSGVSNAKIGDMYLNTETSNTYRCTVAGAASAAKWVYAGNIKGEQGDAAITMSITSSAGTIFKNTSIATTLTAHVYMAGQEVSDVSTLGTIKWYKDGGQTAVHTGATLSISAGDVTNKAVYVAQLESA